MSTPDQPEVIFVNSLAVNGFLNGVVNLTFMTARWTVGYEVDGKPIVVEDPYVSSLLRMDLHTAMVLRDALTVIIERETQKTN